jgi:hypothetical protein
MGRFRFSLRTNILAALVALMPVACSDSTGAGDSASETGSDENTDNYVQGDAQFSVNISVSPVIGTVGIVEWSVDKSITGATIDFGRDANNFELQAPADVTDGGAKYRTLLLGMKPSTTYSVRITARGNNLKYVSDIYTVTTGPRPSALPDVTVTNYNATASLGGFTVTCNGAGSGLGETGESWAFIFDKDGDMVWWYDLTDTVATECTRARTSYDGKYMWAGNFSNVEPTGALLRVTMDGIGEPDTYSFPGRNHDFAVLPNGHILFQEQKNGGGYTNNSEGADYIKELDPETKEAVILYDESEDFTALLEDVNGSAHTNFVAYVPAMNAIAFSMRHCSTIVMLSYPDSQIIGIFGGADSWFSEMNWDYQHGFEIMENELLVFNNGADMFGGGAHVLRFSFDLNTRAATQTLDYEGGVSSAAFGDVQQLPNGNIFITYSTSGVFQEITSDGTLLREMSTDFVGYSEQRKTLYGPPPPFDK